ncbi:MAG: LysR family transcriptional regulator [Oscillospiraceae bacterium]|nr:LysR family transcriptional regulator [Oscillospiraceae bacterium]
MQFSSLRIFLSILESGSFSQAAKLEHLSQPALSSIVANLEKEVGYKLLDRTPGQRKRVEPTPAGKRLADFARKTLLEYDRTLLQIAERAKDLSSLTVSVTASPSATVFPILCDYFREQYPLVELYAMQTQSSHTVFQQLFQGPAALCISGSAPHDPRLASLPFFYDPPVLICSTNANLRQTISLRDLSSLPLIHRPEQASNLSATILRFLEKRGIRKSDLNIILEVPGDADVLHAVSLTKNAVGFVSRSLFELSGAQSSVRQINVRGFSVERYLHISYVKETPLSLEARLFMDCAKRGEWARGYFTSIG